MYILSTMFGQPFSKLINLTKDEKKTLTCLTLGTKSMSDIARSTKIPRTTLYTTITSLLSRGLIYKNKISNQTHITLKDRSELDTIIFNESSYAKNSVQENVIPTIQDYKIIYGLENTISMYQEMCSKKNERIYTIQPTRSMLSAVKKISPEELIKLNEKVKKNHIIFDAIIHQNYMTTYMNNYLDKEGKDQTQKSLLESLQNRLSDTRIIDGQYLNVSSEIFLTSTQLYIFDWEHESCIKINNRNIISLLKEMFLLAKAHSKKIDYHKLIEESLGRI